MSARIFNPLFILLARLTSPQLARTVQFLKAENEILRSKLPKRPRVTSRERTRLLKLGLPLGQAIKQLITIVTYRTFRRWANDGKKGKRRGPHKAGRPSTSSAVSSRGSTRGFRRTDTC